MTTQVQTSPEPTTMSPVLPAAFVEARSQVSQAGAEATAAETKFRQMYLALLQSQCARIRRLEWDVESYSCDDGTYGHSVGQVLLIRDDETTWQVFNIDDPESTEICAADGSAVLSELEEMDYKDALSHVFGIDPLMADPVTQMIQEAMYADIHLESIEFPSTEVAKPQ